MFKWGEWADASDRVPGHPNSVETIVKLDEDTVITGSSDGLIRWVLVCPWASCAAPLTMTHAQIWQYDHSICPYMAMRQSPMMAWASCAACLIPVPCVHAKHVPCVQRVLHAAMYSMPNTCAASVA